MKLIDMLISLDENKDTTVITTDGYIFRYDGKDEIPAELNDRDVISVIMHEGNAYIMVA